MAEHLFINTLEAIKQPAILLDRNYRICAANQAYRDTFGAPPDNSHCYEVSHGYAEPCDQAGEQCPLKNCLATNRRQRVLHIHNCAAGREHIDVELTPLVDEHGDITHFVEVMQQVNPEQSPVKMHGFSTSFTQMLNLLSRAANSHISVLLQGETGSGKEVAAHYLHEQSPRREAPFVVVECSGLSESLFESELFGHEKGAFTGAVTQKIGLVEAAEGGTLFLDEIGDVPLNLQVKLLRLLETGKYRRVGSIEEKSTNFRLVCASHKNLAELVQQGEFRQDLYYRICPFPVEVPPLRERQEDIPLIAQHLLEKIAPERPLRFSPSALQQLKRHRFPGNIRELRNLIERATLLCDGEVIQDSHLQLGDPLGVATTRLATDFQLKSLAAVEADYLLQAQSHYQGDKRQLAAKLGISERTLYRKLEQAVKTAR